MSSTSPTHKFSYSQRTTRDWAILVAELCPGPLSFLVYRIKSILFMKKTIQLMDAHNNTLWWIIIGLFCSFVHLWNEISVGMNIFMRNEWKECSCLKANITYDEWKGSCVISLLLLLFFLNKSLSTKDIQSRSIQTRIPPPPRLLLHSPSLFFASMFFSSFFHPSLAFSSLYLCFHGQSLPLSPFPLF